MSEWISVKDRLPTYAEVHDDRVLALFEDGDVGSVSFDEYIDDECERFGYWKQYFDEHTLGATDTEWIPIRNITHWMPLPKAPEGEAVG